MSDWRDQPLGTNPSGESWKDAPISSFGTPPPEPASLGRRIADVGVSLGKGALNIGPGMIGLADMVLSPTGLSIAKGLHDTVGYDPKAMNESLDTLMSNDALAARKKVSEAFKQGQQSDGLWNGIVEGGKTALENPSTIINTTAESVPQMFGGGAYAKILQKGLPMLGRVAPKLGQVLSAETNAGGTVGNLVTAAAGEGMVSAGSTAENIRQENASGVITPKQAALAAASGLSTMGGNLLAGGIANKLGVDTLETMLARGSRQMGPQAIASKAGRVGLGMAMEGGEETIQAPGETAFQNIALNKPWDEGMAEAIGMGALSGIATGGATGLVSKSHVPPELKTGAPTYQSQTFDPAIQQSLTAETSEFLHGAKTALEEAIINGTAQPGSLNYIRHVDAEIQRRAELPALEKALTAAGAIDQSTLPTDPKAAEQAAKEAQAHADATPGVENKISTQAAALASIRAKAAAIRADATAKIKELRSKRAELGRGEAKAAAIAAEEAKIVSADEDVAVAEHNHAVAVRDHADHLANAPVPTDQSIVSGEQAPVVTTPAATNPVESSEQAGGVTQTSGVTFAGKDVSEIKSPGGANVTHHFTSEAFANGISLGGSEYVLSSDGAVLRNKGDHKNTGKEDSGLKKWNSNVLFLESGAPVNAPAGFNTDAHTAMSNVFKNFGKDNTSLQFKDGVAVMLVFDGKSWRQATWGDAFQKSAMQLGIQDAPLQARASAVPAIGLHVLDYSTNQNGGITSIHNGSPVTSVTEINSNKQEVTSDSTETTQQEGQPTTNPDPVTQTEQVTTAEAIEAGLNNMRSNMSGNMRDEAASHLLSGNEERITYHKPHSIEAARQSPYYNVRDNADGSVTVIGVLNSENKWVGVAPTQKEGDSSVQSQTEEVRGRGQEEVAPTVTPDTPVTPAATQDVVSEPVPSAAPVTADETPHYNQPYVDSQSAKIDKIIFDYAGGIGTSWERNAVKRHIANELQSIVAGNKNGEWAAAKIAVGKAETFDQLKQALQKLVPQQKLPATASPDSQQAGVSVAAAKTTSAPAAVKPAPLRMDGTPRPAKPAKEPIGAFAGIHPKSQEIFNTAFDSRDTAKLKEILHMANPVMRAEFENRTGEKLPKTLTKTKEAIDKWAATPTPEAAKVDTVATAPDTPAAVVTEAVAANDNTKLTLKEQKENIVGQIDKAITAVAEGGDTEFKTFKIPGDGTFNIDGSEKALKQFREQIIKEFKTGPEKATDALKTSAPLTDEGYVSKTISQALQIYGTHENAVEKMTRDKERLVQGKEWPDDKRYNRVFDRAISEMKAIAEEKAAKADYAKKLKEGDPKTVLLEEMRNESGNGRRILARQNTSLLTEDEFVDATKEYRYANNKAIRAHEQKLREEYRETVRKQDDLLASQFVKTPDGKIDFGSIKHGKQSALAREYNDLKKQFPGKLLVMKVGNFFEFMEEDAKIASKILDIALTHNNQGIPIAGVPYHSIHQAINKLLNAGYEVATAEQPDTNNVKSDKLEDFGEKLGGARKDHQLSLDADLSDADIANKTLGEIWPKKEVDAIEDPFVAAVATAARAEVPNKPQKGYKLDRWVKMVQTVRMLAKLVQTVTREKFMEKAAEFKLEGFTAKVRLLEQLDRSLWGRIGKVVEYKDAYRFDDDGKKVPHPWVDVQIDGRTQQFLTDNVLDALDKIQEKLGVAPAEKKMQFEVRGSAGSYNINKKGDSPLYRSLKKFDNSKDALAFVKNNHTDLVQAWEDLKNTDNVKESDVRRDDNRPRTGADHRKGKDVTPEMILKDLGFRGIEFGNWVGQGKNEKERQGMLNSFYDAIFDLANILGVPPKALSLNGTLGIGFGSRGSGKFAAHYEPTNLVINLTKTRGAGSLAHELFHAIDRYFQMQRNPEWSLTKDNNYITYNPETYYEDQKTGHRLSATRFNELKDKKYGIRNPENWKRVEGVRTEVAEAFDALVKALDASPMSKRSSLIDKGKSGGYWGRIIERGARAFENYVIFKMQQQGYHNDYLANVTTAEEFSRDLGRYPYLLDTELGPVVEAFDNLFSTIETKETDKGVALYKTTTDTTPTGLKVSDISHISGKHGEAVQSTKDLPAHIQEQMKADGVEAAKGVYDPLTDKVYLIADHIKDANEAATLVISHELTHKGLEALGTEGKQLLQAVAMQHGKEINAIISEAKAQGRTINRLQAANEFLAREGETKLNPKLWQRIVNFIKDAALKMFGMKASDKDVREVLARVRESLDSNAKADGTGHLQYMTAAAHKSPHLFDKFSSDYRRTGEGALAYGAGHYFYTNDDVGEKYHKQFEGRIDDKASREYYANSAKESLEIWQQYKRDYPAHAKDFINNLYEHIDRGLTEQEEANELQNVHFYNAKMKDKQILEPDIVDHIVKNTRLNEFKLPKAPVRTYQVELAPEDSELLLWDKPLSEQSKEVSAMLAKIPQEIFDTIADNTDPSQNALEGHNDPDYTGGQLYKILVKLDQYDNSISEMIPDEDYDMRYTDPREAVSAYLLQLGIKGNKYLDGFSRKDGAGSYNYVIFSDDDVAITAKYSRSSTPVQNPHESAATLREELAGSVNLRGLNDSVRIIHSKDAPQNIKPDAKAFVTKDGIIYFLYDKVEKGTAHRLALHEIGNHYGLQAMVGIDKWQQVMKQMENLRNSSEAVRKAFELVPSDTAADMVTEEALGYLAEIAPQHSVIRRIKAAVRAFLFKYFGMDAKRLTDDAMISLLQSSLNRVNREAGRVEGRTFVAVRTSREQGNFETIIPKFFDGSNYDEIPHHFVVAEPSVKLKQAGINSEIHLKKATIKRKMDEDPAHHYTQELLLALPQAINSPIMIFDNPDGHKDIITELAINGSNVLVGIKAVKISRYSEISSIRTIFGKETGAIKGWIKNGRKVWYDKEKAQQWLNNSRPTTQGHVSNINELSENSIPFLEDNVNTEKYSTTSNPVPKLKGPAASIFTKSPYFKQVVDERTYNGTTGQRRHITMNQDVWMPIAVAESLKGVMNEKRAFDDKGNFGNYTKEEWAKLLEDIKENGLEHPIFITVDYGGKPEISEGNHRIQALKQLGYKWIPAQIRYFGNAQEQTLYDESGRFINPVVYYSTASPNVAAAREYLAGISSDSILNGLKNLLPHNLVKSLADNFPRVSDAMGAIFSTPEFEAERDAKNRKSGEVGKTDFVRVGEERQMNNMETLLSLMGYDGPNADKPGLYDRLKKNFTEWESTDTSTEYGQIERDVRTKLDKQQQANLDLLQSEGDVNGVVYASLAEAMKNKRIAAAKPSLAAFQGYKRVRTFIDGPMAKAREEAIRKLGTITGTDKATIEKTIAAYREHLGKLKGWMPRKHGEGNFQTNIYHVIKNLPFTSKAVDNGHAATLPFFAGNAVKRLINKFARENGLTVNRDANGAPIVMADDRTADKIRANIAKLEAKLEATQIVDNKAGLQEKIDALQAKLDIVDRPSDIRIAGFVEASKGFMATVRSDYEAALQPLRDKLTAAQEAGAHKGEIREIKAEMDRLGEGTIKVKVYMRLNDSIAKAQKHTDMVMGDQVKHLDHNYHAGETYEAPPAREIAPITEGTYSDVEGTVAMERLIDEAIKNSTNKGTITPAAAAQIRDSLFRATADTLLQRGAGRHQIKRAEYLIEGYDKENSTQIFKDYMSGAAGMLSKAMYAKQQFDNYRYAPADIKVWAETYIKNNLRNMGKADAIGGNVRALATFMFLGFKVSSVLVNGTQTWTLGVAELGRRIKEGNSLKYIGKAQLDILKGRVGQEGTSPWAKEEKNIFNDVLWKEQEMSTAIHEMSGQGEGVTGKASKFLHTMVGKSLIPFQEMEMMNRRTMVLAAYRAFRTDGMDHQQALEQAVDVNRKVNFEMSRANLPRWAHHPVLRTAYALQSFVWNNWNWIYNRATSGEKADIIALLKYSAMITAIGGVSALAGGDEANKLIRRLTGKDYKLAMQIWSRRHAKEYGTAGEALNAMVWHGGMGALGVNISNAMRLNVPLSGIVTGETTPAESVMGIWSGVWDKGVNTARYAGRGQFGRAIESAAPAFVEAPMKAYRMATQGATTSHGKPVFDENGRQIKYSGLDAAKRAIGLQPAEQSYRSEVTQAETKVNAHWSKERGDLLDAMRVAKTQDEVRSANIAIMKFNRDVRKSQAYPVVNIITQATIQHSRAASKPDKKKQTQLRNAM